MPANNLCVVILAAGKGTRMKSQNAKVLHTVFFHPMVHHVVRAIEPLAPTKTIVIVGHQKEKVQQALSGFTVEFAFQEQQLGTGHAVLSAEQFIDDPTSTVMILCGDTPLVRSETLASMFNHHLGNGCDLTLMTTHLQDPTNYGRIIKEQQGKVTGIVEQKDASPEQLAIKEINAGIYLVTSAFLFRALQQVDMNNSQGEMYLTDIVAIAVNEKLRVETFSADPSEILGVNSRVELALASEEMQMRRNRELMAAGVSMELPSTIAVSPESLIGGDTTLESLVKISGTSTIGSACNIGQGTILHNVKLGDNVVIGPYSFISGTSLDDGTTLPAYSSITTD